IFTILVLGYSIRMEGTAIYELVSSAYQVTLVSAFAPLVFGLFWKRATTQGAITSIVLGVSTWLLGLVVPGWDEVMPAQLGGLLASIAGILLGSLAPQILRNHGDKVTHPA